jgi:hypothetical protein
VPCAAGSAIRSCCTAPCAAPQPTETPRLRAEFVDAASAIRQPLASAIADRIGGDDTLASAVLAAAVSAAARVALAHWVRHSGDGRPAGEGLLVVTGERPLADVLREALAHVAPALQAADPPR